MILVIGATGTTGREVVRELVEMGAPVRGTSRTEQGAAFIRELGAEAAVADLRDPGSLEKAMRGVERFYLVTPLDAHQAEWEQTAVSVGEYAGAYHCVKLGVLGQSAQSPLRFSRVHAEATEALQGSSLRWTILMPTGFMQNVLAAAPTISEGRYFSSLEDARVAYVDARDVAEVAARALSEQGHENCSYALTGPAALSHDDLAAVLGEVLGHSVEHVRLGDEEVAAALRQAEVPDWNVDGLVELWRDVYRAGLAEPVTADIEALLGRPPTSFEQFASDHRIALRDVG